MDVFSRYQWLEPLKRRKANHIAPHLKTIYDEHGPPKKLPRVRGKKFKKEVKTFCRTSKIRTNCSSQFHPQSQGKVERSHKD